MPAAAYNLYCDLLKRTLSNTLFKAEPDTDQANELRFVSEFIDHYIKAPAISMLPLARFDNIQACVEVVVADGVRGDLIETGVWRGGGVIFMRGVLNALGDKERTVWAADSFEGLPEPNAEKYPIEAKSFHGPVLSRAYNHFAADLDQVRRNFAAFGVADGVQFLKGWFKDTLPTAPIERLALLRLDGDYYESTRDALLALYSKVTPGGFVIVDDYGEDSWTYCRKAVDEFRAEVGDTAPLIRVDSKCYFWRKVE